MVSRAFYLHFSGVAQVASINCFAAACAAADQCGVKGKVALLRLSQLAFTALVDAWHVSLTSNIVGLAGDYFLKCILDVWIPLIQIDDVSYAHAFPVRCPAYLAQLGTGLC